ncbi:MAG: LPS export ABC transporter permease LptG [Candidatus Eisenbacteria bacterium]|nr:LPS export ABC transporter permease LptG [Candidatus Eisenbacteria bacterium]
MSTLFRYVFGKVVRPLGLLFAISIGIFILVDLFDHAHSFIDNEVPFGVAFTYYLYYMPLIFVLTSPVVMLLATLLSVGSLSKNSEIMAMKGSGVSLYRFLVPVLTLALLVGAADILVGELLLPQSTRSRISIEETRIKKKSEQTIRNEPVFVRPDNVMFIARRLNTRTGTLEQVTVEHFDRENESTMRLDAESAVWQDGVWVFFNGRERTFEDGVERVRAFETLRSDYYDPTPEELSRRRLSPDEMSYSELRSYITRLRASGNDPRELAVQLRLKVSFAFVTLIMTLLGGTLAAGARRSGFALSFAAALAISFIYYGLLQVGQVLGRQGILVPWLAAWLANIVFAGIGSVMLVKAPK